MNFHIVFGSFIILVGLHSCSSACPTDLQCEKSPDGQVCSGRGVCKCGHCVCPKRFSGRNCECDSLACPRAPDDNSVCGGKERGVCTCNGKCVCKRSYTGRDCSCLNQNEPCRNPTLGTICSNAGTCTCGLCFCDPNANGIYCQYPRKTSSDLNKLRRKKKMPSACGLPSLQECLTCLLDKADGDRGQPIDKCKRQCGHFKRMDISVEMTFKNRLSKVQGRCDLMNKYGCARTIDYRWLDTKDEEQKVHISLDKNFNDDCPVVKQLKPLFKLLSFIATFIPFV